MAIWMIDRARVCVCREPLESAENDIEGPPACCAGALAYIIASVHMAARAAKTSTTTRPPNIRPIYPSHCTRRAESGRATTCLIGLSGEVLLIVSSTAKATTRDSEWQGANLTKRV